MRYQEPKVDRNNAGEPWYLLVLKLDDIEWRQFLMKIQANA